MSFKTHIQRFQPLEELEHMSEAEKKKYNTKSTKIFKGFLAICEERERLDKKEKAAQKQKKQKQAAEEKAAKKRAKRQAAAARRKAEEALKKTPKTESIANDSKPRKPQVKKPSFLAKARTALRTAVGTVRNPTEQTGRLMSNLRPKASGTGVKAPSRQERLAAYAANKNQEQKTPYCLESHDQFTKG